ncbi:hypothetical protein OHA98_12545 [Streptomyces sp. NBC_00654]|nr:hypothetical protein [Streptomyces sp. NBC_00654]
MAQPATGPAKGPCSAPPAAAGTAAHPVDEEFPPSRHAPAVLQRGTAVQAGPVTPPLVNSGAITLFFHHLGTHSRNAVALKSS